MHDTHHTRLVSLDAHRHYIAPSPNTQTHTHTHTHTHTLCPQIMVSMLFADVVGYSKFKNEQIVHFVNNYLAMVTHRHLYHTFCKI